MKYFCNTDIDSRCTEFDNGTALHIAASNLAHEAVKVLLQNGANSLVKDDMDRKPLGNQIYSELISMNFSIISSNFSKKNFDY
jgi:ankyrin repeat protein